MMPFRNYLTGFFRRDDKNKVKALIRSSKSLAKQVFRNENLDNAKKIANDGASLEDRGSRWDVNKRLMETRIEADNQIFVLRKCIDKVDKANELKKELKLDGANLKNFLDCFSERLGEDFGNLEQLGNVLEDRRMQWKVVSENISRKKIRVLISHAIFRLTDISGLELGSLIVGGLIGLGIVYMWFYYQGAAGQFVHKYWTLDDLIIQGINILLLVLVVLFLLEFVFFRILFEAFESHTASKRGKTSDKQIVTGEQNFKDKTAIVLNEAFDRCRTGLSSLFEFFLNHPAWLLTFFVGSILFFTSFVGFLNGRETFNEFVQATNDPETELEVATVVDKTVLRDVFLVGTTSRAAIFLQNVDNDKPNNYHAPSGYLEVWWRVVSLLPIPGLTSSTPSTDGAAYQVLVMDRAQITCHTKGRLCLDLPKVNDN